MNTIRSGQDIIQPDNDSSKRNFMWFRDFSCEADFLGCTDEQLTKLLSIIEDELREKGYSVDDEYALVEEYLQVAETWDDYQNIEVETDYSMATHEDYVLLHNYESLKGFIEKDRTLNQT